MVVVWTGRGEGIRLISVRKAEPKERRKYEEGVWLFQSQAQCSGVMPLKTLASERHLSGRSDARLTNNVLGGTSRHAMPVPAHLSTFWGEFAKATGGADEERFYEAFFFGDGEQMANELAELVLRGTKRATAGSLWSYEEEKQPLPQPGNLSIVTNWSGHPLCVIEIQSVEVVPFHEVTAEFAATEGEGDGSLSFWQQAHREFFSRDCAKLGKQFSESMPVVCEQFAVIYRAATSAA